jgi:hypothetical protein
VLGDEKHCDEAKANNIPCMTLDDLKKMNKAKKLVSKLGKNLSYECHSLALIKNLNLKKPTVMTLSWHLIQLSNRSKRYLVVV